MNGDPWNESMCPQDADERLQSQAHTGLVLGCLRLRRKGWPSWAVGTTSSLLASISALAFWTWQLWDRSPGHRDLAYVFLIGIGICAVALMGVGLIAHRRRALRRIVFFEDGLFFPRREGAAENRWIPYSSIWSFHEMSVGRRRYVLLNVGGRRTYSWSAASFVEPDAVDRFAAAVRAGIERLPDADVRFARLERRAAAAAAAQTGRMWLTWSLPGVFLTIFSLQCWVAARAGELFPLQAGGASRELVQNGELFRLVTANLLHGSFLHLAGNTVFLVLLGFALERLVGTVRFGLVLGSAALGGMGAVVLAGGEAIAIGSSTGVFGLAALLVWVVVCLRDDLPGNLRNLPPWSVPLLVLVATGYDYFLIEIVLGIPVSVAAHVGGAAGGLLVSAWVVRGSPLSELSKKTTRLHRTAAVVMGVVFAAAVLWGGAATWSSWPSADP